MSKHIDVDKLIQKIFPIGNVADGNYSINAKAIKVAIDSIPTADVAEIVRCKDCANSKHWYADKRRCFLWYKTGIGVCNNDYCSYGERRER